MIFFIIIILYNYFFSLEDLESFLSHSSFLSEEQTFLQLDSQVLLLEHELLFWHEDIHTLEAHDVKNIKLDIDIKSNIFLIILNHLII
tara:strand:- start:196 stop:459 length:264 start_codon:yes stop_codon:yes gene_type:complete